MTETLTAPPAQDPAVEKRTFSPSRLKLWMQCPLAWWFRYVHKVPEPPRDDALTGTLVHAVLERLFDVEPERRTPEYAESLLSPEFDRMCEDRGEAAERVKGLTATELVFYRAETIDRARPLLGRYFMLEHPGRFTPKWREVEVFGDIPGTNIRLKGFIDRVDELHGARKIVDYKSSKPTAPMFWAGWEFQIKVYALAMWLSQGVRPVRGEILALGYRPANARWREPEQHGQVAVFPLTEQGLRATAEQVKGIVREIMAAEEAAEERGQWPEAKPSKLCDWCSFQKLCPAQGGKLPEGPVPPKPVEDVVLSDPWATPTS